MPGKVSAIVETSRSFSFPSASAAGSGTRNRKGWRPAATSLVQFTGRKWCFTSKARIERLREVDKEQAKEAKEAAKEAAHAEDEK